MKRLALDLTAESPLAVRADQALLGAAGAGYIPGSTLLGGLTMLYRQFYQGREELELFTPLFLQERVFYPNLYPAILKDKDLQGQISPVYPLPRTAQSCKRHKGFRFPEDDDNDAHGARDSLIDGALLNLAASDGQCLAILRGPDQNCHCKEPLDYFEGYYRRNSIKPEEMVAASSEDYTRLQTRTGIDRASGTVQNGILYNRQVFEEGMRFWGEVIFPDDERLLDGLRHFLGEIGSSGLLRLGTGRTRGMGKLSVAVREGEEMPAQDRQAAFNKRLKDFDATMRQRANYFKLGQLPHGFYFALTLHSPLILCDELLRYRGVIDEKTLQELLGGSAVPGLKLIYHAASTKRVTGWQEIWGTPRAAEFALETGSVFLFACASPPDSDLFAALFKLEEQGAGKRRAEGFGRVCISDPFHRQVQQEKVER